MIRSIVTIALSFRKQAIKTVKRNASTATGLAIPPPHDEEIACPIYLSISFSGFDPSAF
jgi:hypothetical protein